METMQQAEHPTFESVWAMMQENARQLEKMREEGDRRAQEWEKAERYMKRLGRQMGDLHRTFGKMAEHLVLPSITKRFNEIGYHFGNIMPGGLQIYEDETLRKIKTQVDILLENDDSVVAIEVKATVRLNDIGHHARRLEILRECRDKMNDHRAIRGAIAGAIFGDAEKKATLEAGMYVLAQSGDTMRLEVPDGFVPREW